LARALVSSSLATMNFLPPPSPSRNLSIAGLPDISDQQLKVIFTPYGDVEDCKMLPNSMPGVIGNGALVIMSSLQRATWLVENLSGIAPLGLTSPVIVSFLAGPGESATVLDTKASSALSSFAYATAAGIQAQAPAEALQVFQTGVPLTGTVTRWDDTKGFGFIGPHCNGPEVFVHIGDFQVRGGRSVCDFQVGLEVVFTAEEDGQPGKYKATHCSDAGKKVTQASLDALRSPTLFISGLPLDMTEEIGWVVFRQYGSVESVKKLPGIGKPDSAMIIRMGSIEQAQWMKEHVDRIEFAQWMVAQWSDIPVGLTSFVKIQFAKNRGHTSFSAGNGNPNQTKKKQKVAGWFRPGPY